MKRLVVVFVGFGLLLTVQPFTGVARSAVRAVPSPLRGVTLDNVENLNAIVSSFRSMSNVPTARVVFDEFVPATDYVQAVGAIRPYAYVMGELLDSYYVKQYSVAAYRKRVTEYLNRLGSNVDVWEVGNEVNGEWLGATADVVAKISDAYNQVKARGMKTEMTLYYNPDCWSRSSNEMFTWANKNVPAAMKSGLDYVLISYYEGDCNDYRPTASQWKTVFDRVHTMFPNSKIGFGEIGADPSDTVAFKQAYVDRHYPMSISTPGYVGGYFWWYYYEEMLPAPNALWTTLNDAMAKQASTAPAPATSPTPIASPTPTTSPAPTASPTASSTPTPAASTASTSALLADSFESYDAGGWSQGTTYGQWRAQFDGYGAIGVETDGSRVVSLSPKASTSPGETHGALVTSTKALGDFDMTLRMKTAAQLRTPAPNPWETAWLFWSYTDNTHFYYVCLKPNGWELGKEDPAYPGAQRFLATGSQAFPVGPWYTVRVRKVGATVTVWADGTKLTSFTDGERPYGSGSIGLYTEDAHVHFDDVNAIAP